MIPLQFHSSFIAETKAAEKDNPDLVNGRDIYNFYCYQCHGYSGDANTLASTYLDPRPRDFTTTSPASLSRESMLTAVRDGHPGAAMVAFKNVLDNNAIGAVVDYIGNNLMSLLLINYFKHPYHIV